MSELRYLSRLAGPGSILEWDGKKISPAPSIASTESGISVSGSIAVTGDLSATGVTAEQFRGEFCGRHTAQDSQPLVQPGTGIEVVENESGSFLISQARVSNLLWRWNEMDTSQFEIGYNSVGEVQLSVVENSWGPSLRIKANRTIAGGEPGVLVLNLLQSDRALIDRRRYRLRYRLSNFTGTKASWLGIGAAHMSNMLLGDELMCQGDVLSPSNLSPLGPGGRTFRVEGGHVTVGSHVAPGPTIELSPLSGRCQIDVEHELTYRRSGESLGYQSRLSTGSGYHTSDEVRALKDLGVSRSNWTAMDTAGLGAGIVFISEKGPTRATFDIDSIRLIPHEMDS